MLDILKILKSATPADILLPFIMRCIKNCKKFVLRIVKNSVSEHYSMSKYMLSFIELGLKIVISR